MQGTISQWPSFVLHYFLPLFAGQFTRHHVRIERGPAGQREHLSIRRIQGHDRPGLLAQQVFRQSLEADVNRQIQIVPGPRLFNDSGPFGMTQGVDFDSFLAGGSPQDTIERLLHSVLPDQAPLVQFFGIGPLELFGRNFPDIPD